MSTKNQLVLLALCAALGGCAVSRTPTMTLGEAERFQTNCKIKDQQIAYLSQFVSDWRTTDAHLQPMTQSVLRRKIQYLNNYCL